MKLEQPVPAGEVPYISADGRLIDRSRTPTSSRRPLKDGGPPSTAYGDPRGRTASGVMCGHYSGPGQTSGQPCPAVGQLESTAGQWCSHSKHCHHTSSIHPPPEVVLRQTQRPDYSAAGDRNYFYDVTGTGSGEFTTFVEWDATGNDIMSVDRCHGDESCDTVASEHVYEMAA